MCGCLRHETINERSGGARHTFDLPQISWRMLSSLPRLRGFAHKAIFRGTRGVCRNIVVRRTLHSQGHLGPGLDHNFSHPYSILLLNRFARRLRESILDMCRRSIGRGHLVHPALMHLILQKRSSGRIDGQRTDQKSVQYDDNRKDRLGSNR